MRALLMDAAMDDGAENAVMRKMGEVYATDTVARVTAYNAWMGANFPEEKDVSGITKGGVAFKGLELDQMVGWGLWMTSKGELTWA